jgi:hypothetical protein
MSKLAWIIVGLSAATGVVMTVAVERRSAKQQVAQTERLKEQASRIAQAAAEKARLSNLVARVTTQTLSPEQLRDLLRLRKEVGELRQLEGKKAQLEATNARLREMERKSQETLARARALPNYWPKDQLAFAGYAEPASTVRSLLTALKNGDLNAMLDCFDPAVAAEMEASMQQDLGDAAARQAAFKTMVDGYLAGSDGFHIVDQTMTNSNEVTIDLSYDGEGRVDKVVLKKTGNEWKLGSGFQE